MFEEAVFLAIANKAIVDYLAAPVREKYPDLDLWWLVYVALVTGGLIGWFSTLNLFASIPNEAVGRLLTCVVIGGGSNLIYKIFKK